MSEIEPLIAPKTPKNKETKKISPILYSRQREFGAAEYFFKRIFAALASFGLGGAIVTAFLPALAYWYSIKTKSGQAIMQQAIESTMEDIIRWIDNPLLVYVFIGIWPLIAIFVLAKNIATLVWILFGINILPWVLLSLVKRILMKKFIGEIGLKIKKNWIAKTNIIIKKIIIYPILLILLLIIAFYLQITAYPETFNFTIEEFAHVLENCSRFLNFTVLVYSFIISGLNSYMQSLYVPPKKNKKVGGNLKLKLDLSALGKEREEEEIQVTKTTEYFGEDSDLEE